MFYTLHFVEAIEIKSINQSINKGAFSWPHARLSFSRTLITYKCVAAGCIKMRVFCAYKGK